MKPLVVFASVLLLAATAAAQTPAEDALKAELLGKERQFWEGWQKGDAKPFETMTSADSLGVGVDGVGDRQKMLADIPKKECQVNSFTFEDSSARLKRLAKDTYLLIYKASVDATCMGEKIPSEWWSSTIWQKQKGRWMATYHQETPLMVPPQTEQAQQ